MHNSVRMETPCEFINVTPINPLISKCQIKVCYVGDKPNRNRSIITKEVAKQMANSLPGCPIVGFFNEEKGDFEEHNRIIDISNGKFEIKDTTRPYGFVDLNAKVWFQKYLDDGMNEHEYMMTEGWLWTGQYPECRRILSQGNNQSMELDEETINAAFKPNTRLVFGETIANPALKVFDIENKPLDRFADELGGKTLGETLLTPTKIYVKPVLALMDAVTVRSVSHITGGGFYENIPRSIPDGLTAKITKSAVKVLPIFDMIAKVGNVPERDMFNTFNMGVGMSIVVPADEVETALAILRENGEDAYVIGEIIKGNDGVVFC